MTYNEILSHFTVKSSKDGTAQCICPNHDDKEPSLTISKGKKGTVVFCHACGKGKTPEILEAVGLKMSDLFEEEFIPSSEPWRAYVEGRTKKKIEGVYHYSDLTGKYAFTRIRFEGKKFRYGRLKDNRFSFGLGGKKRAEIPAVFCESLEAVKKAVEVGQRIYYAEGEKDVLTLKSKGLTGITCGSADDWIPSCATLFVGAEVVILQDNDEAGQKLTRDVMKDVLPVAKSVKVVTPTPKLDHGDVSDFFKDHTVEDLEKLVNEAPDEAEILDLDQFHQFGTNGVVTGVYDFKIREYLKETEDILILGKVPLIYQNGVLIQDQSGSNLKTRIEKLIYPRFIKSTTIKRIFELFLSDADLQVTMDDLNRFPVEWINFRNGIYDPINKRMIPHSTEYRPLNQIPFSFDPERGVKGTKVLKWLPFICPDPDDLEMLLQFGGLCLTRDTRQQKFLVLLGIGGTGKSVLIRLINLMVGATNISNISLHQLTQRFSAIQLMGKLVNSCADLEIEALTDTSTIKKVLGEDVYSAEHKGKDPISVRSYAKLIFSTNQLPIVKSEQTNGFYRRLLILQMNQAPEIIEPDFFDQLSEEIEDFIWLCVKALERMYENGRIIESKGSIEAVNRLRCDSDTVEAFLTEKIVKIPDRRIKKLDLYRSYEAFCQDMDRQSYTKQNFYRSMKAKGFSEIKTGGLEYFKGIDFLPKTSPEISLNSFQDLNGEPTPFDQVGKGEI